MNPLIQNYFRGNTSNYWVNDKQLRVLIDVFVGGSSIFTWKEFKLMGKIEGRRVIYHYYSTINTFQWHICCPNSKTLQKCYSFVIYNVKRKWKIRYSIHFLAQQKEPLNKQNSLTRYYSTYLRFLEGFLVTTTTAQEVRFHQYIIK